MCVQTNPNNHMPNTPYMSWYYRRDDGHTSVQVFLGGNKLGDLVLSHDEFNQVLIWHNQPGFIKFVDESGRERLLPTTNRPRE